MPKQTLDPFKMLPVEYGKTDPYSKSFFKPFRNRKARRQRKASVLDEVVDVMCLNEYPSKRPIR